MSVYNGPFMDGIIVNYTSFVVFFQVLLCLYTLFILHYFHVAFFPYRTLFVFRFFHDALSSCCIFFMLHFFGVALSSCCFFFYAVLCSCCTLSMLHFFHVALFSCFRKFLYNSYQSHKKQKEVLETRTVLIEISMLCWNLPSRPKHRGSL